jgi:aldose 1-epimerase
MPNVYPSGEQIEIRAGSNALWSSRSAPDCAPTPFPSRDVLDGYDAEEMAGSGRGQVLIPWPNRIQDGAYEFAGTPHQLPLNEPAAGNAIHGLVRWASWSTGQREADRVALAYTLHPQPGYPFSTRSQHRVRPLRRRAPRDDERDERRARGLPLWKRPAPYLTLGTEKVDTLLLHAPAGPCCTPMTGGSQ